MAAQDPVYGTNIYNLPKVLSETDSYVRNVLVLLFGRPGFYPSIPELGMDIYQYLYKFEDEINPEAIKSELVRQCEAFLPEVDSGDLDVWLEYQHNKPVLVFSLPVVINDRHISVVLGVTTDDKGSLIYKYIDNEITQII